MTASPNDAPEEAIDYIEHGLEAYFAGDTARRLLAAIDWESFIEGTAVEEPVDYEQVGEVCGRLLARALIKEVSHRRVLGQFIETTIGQELGGRLGEAAVGAVIESGTPEAIADIGDEIGARDRDLGADLFDRSVDTPTWEGADVTTIDIDDTSDNE